MPVPLALPLAPFPALLDFTGELADPPGTLQPFEPLAVPDPLLTSGAAVLDPAAAPPEPAPVPDAAPEPAPALAAPPRSVAMPLLEAREEEPVGAGGDGEIDSRATPMHSVRARAL